MPPRDFQSVLSSSLNRHGWGGWAVTVGPGGLFIPLRRVMPTAHVIAVGLVGLCGAAMAGPPIDFNRDVRPILSDKCFQCHGPDAAARKADLRLDLRDNSVDASAIVPSKPDASELLTRITSRDPDIMMPPPSTGKQISGDDIDILRRWIETGADYETHWAFVAPVRPPVPDGNSTAVSRSPIDPFVLARLEREVLLPNPPADRTTLVRRLFLDLIGLPPSIEELDMFAADTGDTDETGDVAEQQLVEYLLQSPHFGEHWARWWLDAARYADSDGYEKDKQRSVWFYRDWVINALNDDKPYDQFIIEQIAGDLLPVAGQAERVATGFLRNSMVNEEGGADPEQFRVEGMFDRMDAVGKAILGITTQCAQCHSHKFDPLTQTDYYRMFAALNDFHEAMITVYTPDEQQQRELIQDRIASIENEIKEQTPDWNDRMMAWANDARVKRPQWDVIVPTDVPFDGQKFRLLDDGSIVCESYAPTKTQPMFSGTTQARRITAFRIDVLTHPQLPRSGPGRSIYGTGALTEFNVFVAPASHPDRREKIPFVRAVADVNPEHSALPAAFREKNAEKDDRVTGPIEYAFDGNNKTAWTTDNDPGRRNQNRHAIFIPDKPVQLDGDVVLSFHVAQNHGGWNSDDNQNYLLGRYRFSVTADANPDAIVVSSAVESVLAAPPEQWTAAQRAAVFGFWRTTVVAFSDQNQRIDTLWKSYPAGDTQLAVVARTTPRETHVLYRGDFLKPLNRVTAGAPEFLNPMQDTDAPDRLDFARWLVSRDAPTTARAIVNRIWQAYFGRGLVLSPEDLGSQSIPPSHPELLDWLATELMDHGWSLKHIHRLIVTSATYRQSSQISPAQLAADRYNELLARGARFRVNAEAVRDIALASSGLLQRHVGGPSVYPPAPEFLFEPPASYGPKNWFLSQGDDQYRRSVYVHSYRSVPYPALQLFDAPRGDAACIRRNRSNTPLQALVVLNEPVFVNCARSLARRTIAEGGSTDADRLGYVCRLSISRRPDDEETRILLDLLAEQRNRLRQGTLDARLIVADSTEPATAEASQSADDESTELAAWTIVARTILNLDETITRQ